jgi:hypothetical protein
MKWPTLYSSYIHDHSYESAKICNYLDNPQAKVLKCMWSYRCDIVSPCSVGDQPYLISRIRNALASCSREFDSLKAYSS